MGLFQFCAGNGTRWICSKLDLANLDLWTLLKDGDCHLEYHIPDTPPEDQEDPLKYTLQRCVSKDFLQLWSNNNRLIISCVFMLLTSQDIFSFQLIFLLLTVVWITIRTDQLTEADWDSQNYDSQLHIHNLHWTENWHSWHLNWINKFKLQRNTNTPSRTALGA